MSERATDTEIKCLREALRPFAEFADRFGETAREDNWELTRNPSGKGNLTMGHVRHARAVYRSALSIPPALAE